MKHIKIDISTQTLTLLNDQEVIMKYSISTAKNGPGQLNNSGKTPIGMHIIRAKIGSGQPMNAVFRGRRPTGEVYTPELGSKFPERDWILSRILWLSGCEIGKNRLSDVDTMRRFIYIHGTPYEDEIGKPVSHGCIRMCNADVVDLFDSVGNLISVEIAF